MILTFKIIMHARLRLPSLATVALTLLYATGPAGAGVDAAAVQRLLGLLGGVDQEYAEAFDAGGALVRPTELDEARLLLTDAQAQAARLGRGAPTALAEQLAALVRAVDAHAPAAGVSAQVRTIRDAIREATGVGEEIVPSNPPSPARGRPLYQAYCASCHGEHGAGDGPDAGRLERKPANFTDPSFMRDETPADFFRVVSLGRRRAAMPAWEEALSVQERWDVIGYLWTLRTAPGTLAEGQGLFLTHCASCHGADGDAHGPYASRLLTTAPDLRPIERLAGRADTELYDAVTGGIAGTAMPAFRKLLTDEERWKTVAFVRALSLGLPRTAPGGAAGTLVPLVNRREAGVEEALVQVERKVAAAEDAYARGEAGAGDLAADAYLLFEPLEARIGARDRAAVRRVEEAFLRLRTALRQPGGAPEVEQAAEAVRQDLQSAAAALRPRADAYARFTESATIILREGAEVVLIIGALLAWVTRSGTTALRKPVYVGTVLGVLASVATAALLATVFRLTPGLSDVLEGIAMLVAAVVLFWVSYWIVSKAEAERWQHYLRGRVERAVGSGSRAALAAAAFLAVYREGFETVLFYQALLGGSPASDASVAAGFVSGAALLALLYGGFKRFGLRLPLRPFFLVTGAFLSVMAVAMAGKGVHELQEAGAIGVTPLPWSFEITVLGVFATAESLIAQAVLILLVLYGILVTLHARRRGAAACPTAASRECEQPREMTEAMASETRPSRS